MAEKDEQKVIEDKDVKVVRQSPPWPLITIGIVGTVVVLALIVGGWAFVRSQSGQQQSTAGMGRFGQTNSSSGQQMYGNTGGGTRSGRGGAQMTAAAARGVITAINGDTITVSGSGKQVTVMKTSTTTISGDKTDIAVNDTVIVTGSTASDGTVTATRITVQNQQAFGRATDDTQEDSDQAPGV